MLKTMNLCLFIGTIILFTPKVYSCDITENNYIECENERDQRQIGQIEDRIKNSEAELGYYRQVDPNEKVTVVDKVGKSSFELSARDYIAALELQVAGDNAMVLDFKTFIKKRTEHPCLLSEGKFENCHDSEVRKAKRRYELNIKQRETYLGILRGKGNNQATAKTSDEIKRNEQLRDLYLERLAQINKELETRENNRAYTEATGRVDVPWVSN